MSRTGTTLDVPTMIAEVQALTPRLNILAAQIAWFTSYDVAGLLHRLTDDPGDEDIQEAIDFLRRVREMLDNEKQAFANVRGMRNQVVAAIVSARPTMKMAFIAEAAGINDSLASRVARDKGAAPRSHRPARPGN